MTATTTRRPAPPAAAQPLTLDERLALAALAVPDSGPLDVGEVVRLTPTTDAAPQDATGAAALLERARQRILRDGWAPDAAHNGHGGKCLAETIRAEARSHAEEGEARLYLRRVLGGDPITHHNRRLTSAAQAAHVLAAAAALAERNSQ